MGAKQPIGQPVGNPIPARPQLHGHAQGRSPATATTREDEDAETGGTAPRAPRRPGAAGRAVRSVCGGDRLAAAALENLPFASFLPCLPLQELPGHISSFTRAETGLSSAYFPAPHCPWRNSTPGRRLPERCPHLLGASTAPKGCLAGRWSGGGGCGWPDRFEFSFLALLISCHANPDTGKSLDHAERLRVCVCGCALGEGANRQRFTRENRRTRWHGEAGGWWGPRWVGRFGCLPLCSCCGCPQNTPVSPRGATHTPARMCPCVGKEMPCLGWAWQGGKAGVLPPDAPPTPTPCPGIL